MDTKNLKLIKRSAAEKNQLHSNNHQNRAVAVKARSGSERKRKEKT